MSQEPKEKLSGIKENVALAPFTTFKIGGPAQYFYVAKKEEDLVAAIDWAVANEVPYHVLGGGSNLLVSDEGFAGLVIKNENIDFKLEGNKVYAGSGLNLGYFVSQCTENSLTGAEFLIGIPGTVGGAVRGNAGAWGQSIGDLVTSVKVFAQGKIQTLNQHACRFVYRGSLLKEEKYSVLSAIFTLQKGLKEEIEKKVSGYLQQRSSAQQPKEPSAGSIFKNIELKNIKPDKVRKALDVSESDFQEVTKHGKLPAGYVVEALGLKGKKIGGAQISEQHGNFIISDGTATASAVIQLISYIKQQVRDKVGIELEEEIQYLGF
jgi:UDP-N-acetylmuramate dehydrogenase